MIKVFCKISFLVLFFSCKESGDILRMQNTENVNQNNGLENWYKHNTGKKSLKNFTNLYKTFTGNDIVEDRLRKYNESTKLSELTEVDQKFIYEFLECFYNDSVLNFKNLGIKKDLHDTNVFFLIKIFRDFDLDEKTGKGQSTLNYKYYRTYKERSYGQTINNWNNIGVIPKIFVWDSKNKSENLTKDCNFEICSIKTIIEYFIDNDINGKSKEFKFLLYLIEQIIKHTKYCKTLNISINDENYNLQEKLNYQMRYGTVNLLKVVITHYLSLHKEYSGKILSCVDWVVTPTANLGNLPDDRSIIYGSKVYSGLTTCSENIIENTAIFVNNSRDNSIFSNFSIDIFYDRAITFLKYLIESQQGIKNSIEDFIKLDCDTMNCIKEPSLFRKNHSFVYNLFIELIENIEFEQMKTIHKGELSNYLTEKLENLLVNFDKIKISELKEKQVCYEYLEDIFKEITTVSEELISNSGIDYMSQLSLRKSISSFKKRFFDKTEELSILDMHKFFIESRKLFISTIGDSLSKDWIKNKFGNTILAIPVCITRRSGHAQIGII